VAVVTGPGNLVASYAARCRAHQRAGTAVPNDSAEYAAANRADYRAFGFIESPTSARIGRSSRDRCQSSCGNEEK